MLAVQNKCCVVMVSKGARRIAGETNRCEDEVFWVSVYRGR